MGYRVVGEEQFLFGGVKKKRNLIAKTLKILVQLRITSITPGFRYHVVSPRHKTPSLFVEGVTG